MDNVKRDVSRRRENDCVNFARTNVIRKTKKKMKMFTNNALCFNILIGYYWLSNMRHTKIQNLWRVAAKIDFFLLFCFYMQLLFDVLLYEYAGMLNRGWEPRVAKLDISIFCEAQSVRCVRGVRVSHVQLTALKSLVTTRFVLYSEFYSRFYLAQRTRGNISYNTNGTVIKLVGTSRLRVAFNREEK